MINEIEVESQVNKWIMSDNLKIRSMITENRYNSDEIEFVKQNANTMIHLTHFLKNEYTLKGIKK